MSMPPRDLSAYSICRTCTDVTVAGQGCPRCDGGQPVAPRPRARQVEAVAPGLDDWFLASPPASRRATRLSTVFLGAALFAGLMLLLAALTQA
jgi:hypothetical protein